jgi:hypothetical protein
MESNVTRNVESEIPQQKNNPTNKTSTPLWVGLCFAGGFFFIFLTRLGIYGEFWSIMVTGAVIGLAIGSLFGIKGAKMFAQRKNPPSAKSWLGLAIVFAILIGMLFMAIFSYLLWQEGDINSKLYCLLANCSSGFLASYFLAEGITERYIRR